MKGHNSFSIKAFGKYHYNWKSDNIGITVNQEWFDITADLERANIKEYEKLFINYVDDSSEYADRFLEAIEVCREKIWECEHSWMLWNMANGTEGLKF